MTEKDLALTAQERSITGKQVKALRAEGLVPAVLYGFEVENTTLAIDAKEFRKIYREAGSNTLINLKLGSKTVKILIHDVQLDPVRDTILHADLYAVNLKEKVETEVPLSFIGESLAVRELEGNLVTNLTMLEVKSLPSDIPSEIEVDIAVLKTFDDEIRVKDLKIPAAVEVLTDPETMVAVVEEPMSEEELEAELAPVDAKAAEAEAAEAIGAEPVKEGEAAEGEEGAAPAGQDESAKSEKTD